MTDKEMIQYLMEENQQLRTIIRSITQSPHIVINGENNAVCIGNGNTATAGVHNDTAKALIEQSTRALNIASNALLNETKTHIGLKQGRK